MSELDEHIKTLYQKNSWLKTKLQRQQIDALRSIAASGTPFNVNSIFDFIFSYNKQIAFETAQTIHSLMLKVKQPEWTQLYPSFQYISIYKKQIRFLSKFPDSITVELLGIASLNGNGYVREAAILQLQKIKSPRKIPYILLRLADWVSQVRKTAEKAIMQCLKQEYVEAFISYAYILDWMDRVERVDLSSIHLQIIDYLNTPAFSQYLDQASDHPDKCVRMFGYKALLSKISDNSKIIDKGIKEIDPTVRWNIFQNVSTLPANIQIKYIQSFLQDASPKIRSAAMMKIFEMNWHQYRDSIFQNIFSNSPSIRNTARFLIKKGGFDRFTDEYRKRLKTGIVTQGILSGLAETGSNNDFEILKVFVSHPRSKIRAAAVAGLYRLNPERSVPFLTEALKDQNARVRRVSANILSKYRNFDRVSIQQVLREGNTASRISALKVLCHFSRWVAIEDILFLIGDKEEEVRTTAWRNYVKWYLNRSAKNWVKPPERIFHYLENTIQNVNLTPDEIPDFAKKAWQELPELIKSGRQIWKY